MFYRTYFGAIVFDGSSARGIGYQVTIGFDDGLTGQVDALELQSKSRAGGFECHVDFHAGMQTGSGNTNGSAYCMLLVGVEFAIHACFIN